MLEALLAQFFGVLDTFITAIVTAAATALFAWFKSRKTRRRIEKEQIVLGRSIQAQAPYGLTVRRVSSSWTILDEQGSLVRSTTVEGLRVADGITFSRLPSAFTQSPGTVSVRGGIELAHVSPFPKHVSVTCTHPDISDYRYYVEIAGGLTSLDPPLTYTEQISYNSAILMNNRAVAQAYAGDEFKQEYFAWEVNVPTDELELVVTFPDSVRVRCYPGVFWGRSEFWFHHQELKRVADSFTPSANGARFIISKPVVSFRYFIYWTFEE